MLRRQAAPRPPPLLLAVGSSSGRVIWRAAKETAPGGRSRHGVAGFSRRRRGQTPLSPQALWGIASG